MKTTHIKKVDRAAFNRLLLTALMMGVILCSGLLMSPAEGMVLGADGAADVEEVTILYRQSQILQTPWKVSTVAITDPEIADVRVLTPDQILIQGLAIGGTDIILLNEDETQSLQKKVNVVLDEEAFQKTLSGIFPTSQLTVSQSNGSLIIQGRHRNAVYAQQLHEYLDGLDMRYIDLTELVGVQQVELKVRVAEVSKTGLRSLGADWIQAGTEFQSGINIGGILGESITTITPGSLGEIEIGPSATAFGILSDADLAFFLDALAENQYLRLLANPTLIALNGEEASFLAGGEYPIPVPQSGTGDNATITIEYKEYGVRLNFRPTVMGDNSIKLFVAPEVSELDYANGTSIGPTPVPGILSRRAETTIELKSGQSFALAGLMKNTVTAKNSGIPGLGDLPVLGPLFRSVRYQQGETELVILVTANLVEPLNIDLGMAPLPGMLHEAPSDWELYIDGKLESAAPPKLNSVDAEWLKELGLEDLNGPGAWDSYGDTPEPSEAEMTPSTE